MIVCGFVSLVPMKMLIFTDIAPSSYMKHNVCFKIFGHNAVLHIDGSIRRSKHLSYLLNFS